MIPYVLKKLTSGVVLLVVITTVAFTLLYLTGGNIARRILGQRAAEEQVQQRAAELGLDRPIYEQYLDWVSGALRGDLGRSWFNSYEVWGTVTSRLEITLSIVVGTTLFAAAIALILGVSAAVYRGWIDRVLQVVAVLGFAVPGFLIALGLVLVFAIELGWFPATGFTRFSDSPTGWLAAMTLPVLALSSSAISAIAQQIRGSVIDALRQDYVRTLRSRGLGSRRIVARHVLKNAAGPALAVLAVQFVGLFGAAVIVEEVFAIPGLGQLAVSATVAADIPVVMGVVLVTTIIVITVNLVIDLVQAWLNPKVRLS